MSPTESLDRVRVPESSLYVSRRDRFRENLKGVLDPGSHDCSVEQRSRLGLTLSSLIKRSCRQTYSRCEAVQNRSFLNAMSSVVLESYVRTRFLLSERKISRPNRIRYDVEVVRVPAPELSVRTNYCSRVHISSRGSVRRTYVYVSTTNSASKINYQLCLNCRSRRK